MAPQVSVALASCNGEKYLSEQIRSVLSQSRRDLELVVVDDASSDGTARIAEAAESGDSRVRFYRNPERLGLVANFLRAVSLCRGEFVAYSDQDDAWLPHKIETLSRLLEKDPAATLVYSDLEICGEDLRHSQGSFLRRAGLAPFSGKLGERAFLKNLAPGCSMLFRRPVAQLIARCFEDRAFMELNRAKALDDTPYMHDHLALVLASGLGKIACSPKKLVRYRQHGSNNIGAFYKAQDSRRAFIDRLAKRIQALAPYRKELPRIDWGRLDSFLKNYSSPKRPPMPGFLPFFLFMRNAGLKDRALGALDCFLPDVYEKARTYAKSK